MQPAILRFIRNHRRMLFAGVLSVCCAACGSSREHTRPDNNTPTHMADNVPAANGQDSGGVDTPADRPADAMPDGAQFPQEVTDVGFKTPESVYYDASSDTYLVSNVNGSPTAKDNNGFISKVSPSGEILDLNWISATTPNITLNAPKGMAISKGFLYVADIDVVHIFDAASGAFKGKINIPNATFLNDIAADADDTIYVSDTGWRTGPNGFENTGTDAVWRIKNGTANRLVEGEILKNPNGLLVSHNEVLMVNGAGTLFTIGKDGDILNTTTLPAGGLDGIVETRNGSILISSWAAKAVFAGTPHDGFKPIVEDVSSPADIGYDSKRHRLLIPIFEGDAIRIVPLSLEI